MVLTIFAVILTIATIIGIGFIPKKVKGKYDSEGWINDRSGKFSESEPRNSYEWTRVSKGQKYSEIKYGYNPKAAQILGLLTMLIVVFGMIKTVGANQVGIEYDPFNGGVQDIVLDEGIHIKAPWVKVYNIDTVQQELQFDIFSVQTAGSEYAWFEVEVKYEVNRMQAFDVFRNYRGLPSNSMIRTEVQNAVKTAAEGYNIYEILGSSYAEVKAEAYTLLEAKLAESGIQLLNLNFIDIDAGEAIELIIIEKGLAQQQKVIQQELALAAIEEQAKLTTQAETAQAVREAQSNADLYAAQMAADAEAYQITAQATADALKITIQADADLYAAIQEALAIIELGEADAAAYAVVIDAFTNIDAYNEYIHFMQWDGSVPGVVMGENGVLPIWGLGGIIDNAADLPE